MEKWQVYDENGNEINKIVSDNSELYMGEYHLAVEVWIINSRGQILLQQRSYEMPILPGYWGLTTGRVQLGEDSLTGCLREVQEELGIALKQNEPQFLCRIPRQDDTHLLWDLYLVQKDVETSNLTLQVEEVAQAKWVSVDEFVQILEAGKIYKYPEIYDILDMVKIKQKGKK